MPPVYSSVNCCEPSLPSYYNSMNCCEPCCPVNYVKVCHSNGTPDCNPCYDFSTCDLSVFCKNDPRCPSCHRCKDCCLRSTTFDRYCTCTPPPAEVSCPPAPCYVAEANGLCRSRSTICSPVLCQSLTRCPKSGPWDQCCISPRRPGATRCRPPTRAQRPRRGELFRGYFPCPPFEGYVFNQCPSPFQNQVAI